MNIETIKNSFVNLGLKLTQLAEVQQHEYQEKINRAIALNPWFTQNAINTSLASLGTALQAKNLNKWLQNYNLSISQNPKKIGLVLAGNIPLVGFHDLLCCLISGHNVIAKLSSKDEILYDIIRDLLIIENKEFEDKLTFTTAPLKNIDAIIATGSDNSARYFDYYFKKYPNIIRKNRNSVGIISGNETTEDLEALSDDIFTYYGLGCRNVSFVLIPQNYDLAKLFNAFNKYEHVIQHTKYFNNYTYQKAILLMNQISFFDNGFSILKEDPALSSPIGTVHFQYYKSENDIEKFTEVNKHKIQCIVSKTNWSFKTYDFGKAQQPELWDYADDVDTLEFLSKLK